MIESDLAFIIQQAQHGDLLPRLASFVQFLEETRLLSYLRAKGLAGLQAVGPSMESTALLGAKAAGWNEALDLIIDFKEKVLASELQIVETPRSDFGSIDRLFAAGDITKEEADAIRRGDTPKYEQFNSRTTNQ